MSNNKVQRSVALTGHTRVPEAVFEADAGTRFFKTWGTKSDKDMDSDMHSAKVTTSDKGLDSDTDSDVNKNALESFFHFILVYTESYTICIIGDYIEAYFFVMIVMWVDQQFS